MRDDSKREAILRRHGYKVSRLNLDSFVFCDGRARDPLDPARPGYVYVGSDYVGRMVDGQFVDRDDEKGESCDTHT